MFRCVCMRKQYVPATWVSMWTRLFGLQQCVPSRRYMGTSSRFIRPDRESDGGTRPSRPAARSDDRLNRNHAAGQNINPFVTRIPAHTPTTTSPGEGSPPGRTKYKTYNPARQDIRERSSNNRITHIKSRSSIPLAKGSILQEIMASNNEASVAPSSSELVTTDTKELLNIPDTTPELIEFEEDDGNIVTVPALDKQFTEPMYTLAPLVNKSEVLQQLVRLGVDLSQVEKKGVANHVVKMNFQRDIVPLVKVLADAGVANDDIGPVLSKCPYLFKEDVKNLNVRVNYLRSKKFNKTQISSLITRSPLFLAMPVTWLDTKLGFLQQEFQLTGNELRNTVYILTKLITRDKEGIRRNKDRLKVLLCFTDAEIKSIFLAAPRVFLKDFSRVHKLFNYVHNVMGLSHEMILGHPEVLGSRVRILEPRHRFLLKVDRAQYDPFHENFVSLMAMMMADDTEWCTQVAKATLAEFQQFQKLI